MARWRRLRHLPFALLAWPVVFASGWRIARLDRELRFDEMLDRLRSGGTRPLPARLADPVAMAATVEAMLALLPPRRYGICLRRSLVLLDLWSRCGLNPTLHLGFRATPDDRGGHAWITAVDASGRLLQASGPQDTVPVFEL